MSMDEVEADEAADRIREREAAVLFYAAFWFDKMAVAKGWRQGRISDPIVRNEGWEFHADGFDDVRWTLTLARSVIRDVDPGEPCRPTAAEMDALIKAAMQARGPRPYVPRWQAEKKLANRLASLVARELPRAIPKREESPTPMPPRSQ